jgi:hypothetical protein
MFRKRALAWSCPVVKIVLTTLSLDKLKNACQTLPVEIVQMVDNSKEGGEVMGSALDSRELQRCEKDRMTGAARVGFAPVPVTWVLVLAICGCLMLGGTAEAQDTTLAQEPKSLAPTTSSVDLGGGSNLLPSGDDTEPPDGNSMCHGDSLHWEHPYPSNSCSSMVNRHFSISVLSSKPCAQRARRCMSCYNCCALQADEANTCICFGGCNASTELARQKCRQVCVGTFEDDCTEAP